jgi:hypothetical protein
MYLGLHVNYQLFLSNINETWIFSTDFKKYSYIKFHENLRCFMQMETDRHDEVKGHFRNFVKVPKNGMEQNLQHDYG